MPIGNTILVEKKMKTTATTNNNEATVSELVALYSSGDRGKKISFSHQIKKVSSSIRDEVWDQLGKKGLPRPGRANASQEGHAKNESDGRTFWTEEEWKKLTNTVWYMRKHDPVATVLQLTIRAQAQFPEERRRKLLTNAQIKPVIEGLKKIDEEITDIKLKYQNIKNTPNKDEIINQLSDEEVFNKFSKRVLEQVTPDEIASYFSADALIDSVPLPVLVGYTVQKFMTVLGEEKTEFNKQILGLIEKIHPETKHEKIVAKSSAAVIPIPKNLSKITLLGFAPDQAQEISDKFRERAVLNFVDKNDTIPENQDVIVLWARFCSHSMQNQAKTKARQGVKLITHYGGIEALFVEIERFIKQKEAGK